MFCLVIIFILIPAIEIGIFIWTGQKLGIWLIIALIFLSGAVGLMFVRHQGMETWKRLQFALYNREIPKEEILDGICIISGGILLIAPGFLTDFIGFLLVLPWTRKPFKKLITLYLVKKISEGKFIFRRR